MKYFKTLLIYLLVITCFVVLISCGGKKHSSGGLSDEAKIESLIAQTSILEEIIAQPEAEMTQHVKLMPGGYSIVRSKLSIKRNIGNITISGDVAQVECVFTLSGELKFIDKTTANVSHTKTINMQAAGSYTVRRDITGNWYITSYPEYSLNFTQGGGNAPQIELTLSKTDNISPNDSINITANITGAQGSDFYAVFRINKLGLKTQLSKQTDGSYKGTVVIPEVAPVGYYVALLDVIDTTISGDLSTENRDIYVAALKTMKLTVGQPAGVAQPDIDAAEDILFKPDDDDGDGIRELTDEEFNQAYNYLNSALSKDPNHPDANLLMAIAKTIDYIDEIMVKYGTEGTELGLFPFEEEVKIFPSPAYKLLTVARNNPSAAIISKLPRNSSSKKGRLEGDIADIETELPNTLNKIDEIISHLEKVKAVTITYPQYTYQIPKDIFDPSVGAYYIDAGDIHLLLAGFYALKGCGNFAAAYHLNDNGFYDAEDVDPQGWANNDKNQDGWLQPSEYLPPTPFATLKSDGAQKLQIAQQALIDFAKELQAGVDMTLAENPPMILEALTSDQIQDIIDNKHYIIDFRLSMEGTPVTVTPDPKWNVSWTTMRVKLSGLFSPPIADWRSLLPDFDLNMENPKTDPTTGNIIYPDATFNGIFPDMLTDKVFGEKESVHITGVYDGCRQVIATDAITGKTIENVKVSIQGIERTVETYKSTYIYSGCTFTADRQWVNIDNVVFNELKPTEPLELQISAPGYQPKTVKVERSNWIELTVSLTPDGWTLPPGEDEYPLAVLYEWKTKEIWKSWQEKYDQAGQLISTYGPYQGENIHTYKVVGAGETICGYNNVYTLQECDESGEKKCEEMYFQKTQDAIYYIGNYGKVWYWDGYYWQFEYKKVCQDTPKLFLKLPLQVGDSWTVSVIDRYGKTINITISVEAKENVTTPGYTGEAFKISYKHRDDKPEEYDYVWMVRGIGKVKNKAYNISKYVSEYGSYMISYSQSEETLLEHNIPIAKMRLSDVLLFPTLHHLHHKIKEEIKREHQKRSSATIWNKITKLNTNAKPLPNNIWSKIVENFEIF